eukprot:scaffold100456_cov56-Cyclotella_meneghiniana.AAC.2
MAMALADGGQVYKNQRLKLPPVTRQSGSTRELTPLPPSENEANCSASLTYWSDIVRAEVLVASC